MKRSISLTLVLLLMIVAVTEIATVIGIQS
jgi:hypothetical protein